jgi:teichuronic acid exporter
MNKNIRDRSVKAVSWNVLGKFGVMGVNLIVGIIIARILTPADYGLIGMIAIFIALSEVFMRSGFAEAFVQKKKVTHLDANTMLFSNLSISVFFYALLWIFAPAISRFYDQPILTSLTRVSGLILIIQAFTIVQATQLRRNLDFKRKTKIVLITVSLSGIAGVTAAYYGLGVWSLVIKNLINTTLASFGFWLTSNWRPTLKFSRNSFKELFSFGVWVLGTNLLRTFFGNLYKLVIGKFFTAAQLGFYTKAKELQQTASSQIIISISSVSFPVFSSMQDNTIQLRNAMKQFLIHTMAIIVPVMVTLMVVAEPFVIQLLTEKWRPMIPILQILCILGIMNPLEEINLKILLAQGKSNYNFNLMLIKNALTIINIIIMFRFGVIYIVIGEVILNFIAMLISTYYTRKLIQYGIIHQLKDVSKTVLLAVLAGAITWFVSGFVANGWIILFGGTLLSFTLYILFQYLFNRTFFLEAVHLKNILVKPKN